MSSLTLKDILPDNPTAWRFMDLAEQYNLSCYEWDGECWYIGKDLCEAKDTRSTDFVKNFLGTSPKYKYIKLEGENLKAFKRSLSDGKYEDLKFCPTLHLADWYTAYHYLVQGYSVTAKDFSNLAYDRFVEDLAYDSEKDKDQNLTLAGLNLPNDSTGRRLLDAIDKYEVPYVIFDDGAIFTASDLSRAKGHNRGDFVNNFIPRMTASLKENSSILDDVWILQGSALREFKEIYYEQLGIDLNCNNKLTVVGWKTAYHYLEKGYSDNPKGYCDTPKSHSDTPKSHSNTTKDFSEVDNNEILEGLSDKKEETEIQSNLPNDPIISMRVKQLEIEKEQQRLAEEQQSLAKKQAEQAKKLLEQDKTLESLKNKGSTIDKESIANMIYKLSQALHDL